MVGVLVAGIDGEGLDKQGVVNAFIAEIFVWVIGSHGKRVQDTLKVISNLKWIVLFLPPIWRGSSGG